jgi:hypothetical protein
MMSNKPHLRPHQKKQARRITRLLVWILIVAIFALVIALEATGHIIFRGRLNPVMPGRWLLMRGNADYLSAVDIAAMGDVYYRHHTVFVVDPVNYPVGATAGAEPVIHWREQPFADPAGIGKQRARDELICSRCHGFRQGLAQSSADG